MIARSDLGGSIIKRAMDAGYLTLSRASLDDVLKAQKSLLNRRKWLWGRMMMLRLRRLPVPRYAGFDLFRSWLTLSFADKSRSFLGNSARQLVRRYQAARSQ